MLDNSIETLEKQIKSIEYQDQTLVITMMDDTQKVIDYSEEELENLRKSMLEDYSKNKKRYLTALETAITFVENTKVISFLLMLGSFVFLYNLDITVEQKILSGICFAGATMLYHLRKDSLKEKYESLKQKLSMFSYYIENIKSFQTVSEQGDIDYSLHIEEVNNKGMTLKKLKKIANKKDML